MSSSASVPLVEALPWLSSSKASASPSNSRCWLVCDSVETDARFLLHTMACHTLSFKNSSRVYWLACGPWTCQLIAAAMKKLGCDAAASYLRDSTPSDDHPLHIRSVPVDISTRLENNAVEFDVELYVKELYLSIRTWIQSDDESNDNLVIVVDDASALASLVGERLTYCFLLSLRALIKRTSKYNIVIRCSQDYDLDLIRQENSSSVRAGGSANVDWVGAGGASNATSPHIPWERSLPELADGIVNVEPLASGYSREAHGRLVFVSQQSLTPMVMNYCCQDTNVSAIRLRGPSSR